MEILIIGANMILTEQKDEILLIKRKKNLYAGWFAFVGGKMKVGETLLDCIKRETKEETGLVCRGYKPIAILNERLEDKEKGNFHFLIHYWASCAKKTEQINVSSEEGEIVWVPVKMLPKNIVPSDLKILELFLNKEKGDLGLFEATMKQEGIEQVKLSLQEWMRMH